MNLSEKQRDYLLDNTCPVEFLEGATSSGKSWIIGVKFYTYLVTHMSEFSQCALIATSSSQIERLIIQDPNSFYNTFRDSGRVMEYKKSGTGGARIELTIDNKTTIIYLLGMDNVRSFTRILGSQIAVYLVEEINCINEIMLDEMLARCFRKPYGKILASSNGDDPNKEIYKRLNRCRPTRKYATSIPKQIVDELRKENFDNRFRYYHFNMEDNPMLSDETKANLRGLFPVGSYYYDTKIIGIRASNEACIFAGLLSDKLIVRELPHPSRVTSIFIGVDSGSRVDSTSGAKTIYTVTSHVDNFKCMVVLESRKSKYVSHLEKVFELQELFDKWFRIYGGKVRAIIVDSADRVFIKTIEDNIKRGVTVTGSRKNDTVVNNDSSLEASVQLFHHGRCLFYKEAVDTLKQLSRVQVKNGKVIDNNQIENDYYDSWKYSWTSKLESYVTSSKKLIREAENKGA